MSPDLLGKHSRGLLFVVSAPAGTGKSTLVNMLVSEFPHAIAESRSSTTRTPRTWENDKKDYDFISLESFEEKIAAEEFLEYAKVFGNYYGTRKEIVEKLLGSGKHVVLVIDTQGAIKLKSQMDAIFIFISPPSFEELRRRLYQRRSESEEKIQERLLWAKREVAMVPHYDYHIINDHLEATYQVFRSIFIAEVHKRR